MLPEPVHVTVTDDDLQRSRLTVFFRLLLALPHIIWLGMWAAGALLLSPVLWIATLVRTQPPGWMRSFYTAFVRYAVHLNAYLGLAANPFPGFRGDPGTYPVDVEFPEPVPQNRWSIAFRWVLAAPPLMLAAGLGAAYGGGFGNGWSFSFSIGVLAVVPFLAWFACLARAAMPRGFRDLIVFVLNYCGQAYAYALLLTPRYPNADPALAPGADLPEHPVTLSVRDDDLRRSRLTVFFRFLLALPHIVWLTLWGIAVFFVVLVAGVVAVFTAHVPEGMHRFMAAYVRYQVHVNAFLYLAANPFPGFTGAPGSYPIEIEVGPRERHGRWTVAFRFLLVFPAFLVAAALGTAQGLAAVGAWFASLATGRMPHGLRNLLAYTLRYSAQTYAYALLVTPRYPYSGPGPCDRPEAPASAQVAA
jgi:hypothetical protein